MLKIYPKRHFLIYNIQKYDFFKRVRDFILEEKLGDTSPDSSNLPAHKIDERYHVPVNIHMDRLKEIENI